ATIETAKGNIVMQLDAKNTPITVNNFVFLAQQRFYENTYFWRVEAPGLTSPLDGSPSTLQLIQGGAVTKNGADAKTVPGYTIKDEKVIGNYTAGDVAMANTGKPNTGSTQFFICTGDNSKLLASSYTIFGHVTSGMDVAAKISPDDIIKTVTIQVK
ncbi:MAG TPA: peptidylprolyl isomerase, partial [Ktedonobacterales bacterium]